MEHSNPDPETRTQNNIVAVEPALKHFGHAVLTDSYNGDSGL